MLREGCQGKACLCVSWCSERGARERLVCLCVVERGARGRLVSLCSLGAPRGVPGEGLSVFV